MDKSSGARQLPLHHITTQKMEDADGNEAMGYPLELDYKCARRRNASSV
jgi:hypothetical protein